MFETMSSKAERSFSPALAELEGRLLLSGGVRSPVRTPAVHHLSTGLTGYFPKVGDPLGVIAIGYNPGNIPHATVVAHTNPSPLFPFVDNTYVGDIELRVGGKLYSPAERTPTEVIWTNVNVVDHHRPGREGLEILVSGPSVNKIPPGASTLYYGPSLSVDQVYDAKGRLRDLYDK